MNWEAISAIGEIVGAIAVVVTLIYLAIQVRDSTRVAKAATRQSIAEMTMASSSDIVNNQDLAEMFVRDLEGEQLQTAEKVRLYARSYVGMRNWENIHYQFLAGMLSADEWQGFRQNLKAILEWKSMRTYWANESHYYSAAFQKEIASIQKELATGSDELSHGYILNEQKTPNE